MKKLLITTLVLCILSISNVHAADDKLVRKQLIKALSTTHKSYNLRLVRMGPRLMDAMIKTIIIKIHTCADKGSTITVCINKTIKR